MPGRPAFSASVLFTRVTMSLGLFDILGRYLDMATTLSTKERAIGKYLALFLGMFP